MAFDGEPIVKKMEAAFERLKDYQTNVEVRTYGSDGSFQTEKFLYTFKKPKRIRLDLQSPHSGMILIYPGKKGKVTVQPSGLPHLFALNLGPDNRLLVQSSGQQIDQTDVGLLIENITHSLTDQRRGPVDITEEGGSVRIRVPAANHFRGDMVTLYRFFIDDTLWLPVRVEESTSDGHLERSITFGNLKIDVGVQDTFFQLN